MQTVSVIIPCFNEEEGLPQLFVKLKELQGKLANIYDSHFIFIDDGSSDNTFKILQSNKAELTKSILIRHDKNSNLGAALKTGISNAPACDYLTFLDSDCTYDPEIVIELLAKLDEGYDLVTVSPYHPDGKVQGVPAWRLLLSKALSIIYRNLLGTDLFTYTAMVRGVRTEKMKDLISERNDFTFVVESLIKAIKLQLRIAEIPTILQVRKFGTSKMNIIKTILSHLTIIKKLLLKAKI
jgi:dolichol-phosphate mannosyltransferase